TTSVSNAASVINRFIETDRSVTLYTLDLDAAQKLELFRLAEHDVQPENRNYLYNHFTDNCVTRILRNLDTVIGGTLSQQALETPGRLTLRGHVRRHTAAHPVWDWLLNFWMGQVIDKPVSVWQEMFLPSEVGRFIEGFSYTAADGAQHKLVSQVENIYTARRAPVLEAPWNSLGGALAVGVLIALFFYQLEIFKKKNAGLARRLLGAGHALLGIVFGIAGSLLFFLTFFTNHDYTFENSNVLFVNPLLLLAVPFGALLAVTNNEKKARIYENVLCMLWTYVFLAALLSRIITIVPSYYQNNGFVIAVLLPISYMLGVPRIMLRKLISAGLRRQK
ncbi:MAG: DUF4105 domain-containing protein, partial [Spirochaetaceae bacterium]|nr:DUF4105 domain-containing protein [Spirochaetaceae bacterium]